MLLTLSVKNFQSFYEETVLDLQKRSFKTLRPRPGESWNENIETRAAIFGANASGKTTILKSLGLLRDAVLSSVTSDSSVERMRVPHKLHTDEPTSFEVEYVTNDVRYLWALHLDDYGVISETLKANPERNWRLIFSRNRDDVEFQPEAKLTRAIRENVQGFLAPWTLTLSAWLRVQSSSNHIQASRWWTNGVLPFIAGRESEQYARHSWLIELASQNTAWMEVLRASLEFADVGISGVSIEEKAPEKIRQIHLLLHPDQPDLFGEEPEAYTEIRLKKEDVQDYLKYIEFKHSDASGKQFDLQESEESLGTRAWIDLAIPAFYALTQGSVLLIDEIDSSLHPVLVRELISFFNHAELNKHGAQLIFSSHDSTLVGRHPSEVLTRSEIWFVEKTATYSELFSLDEFPVRDSHNIEKRYLQGNYGAIPIVNSAQVTKILSLLAPST